MSAKSGTSVAALFVSGRSIYHHLPGVEAWDAKRDAAKYRGALPVVAHPPCRTWSKHLRHFAKPPDLKAEQELGRFAVRTVLRCGGVLEQPADSFLWLDMGLPRPGQMDDAFCYTIQVEQSWFGYGSRKKTWLLIVGLPLRQLPALPFALRAYSPELAGLSQAGRSRTVTPFAEWLCSVARASWWQHRLPQGDTQMSPAHSERVISNPDAISCAVPGAAGAKSL